MTREQDYVGARTAPGTSDQSDGPPRTYPVRLFVTYRQLVEKGRKVDPERVVEDYARAHPDVDLDQPTTFADWRAGTLPGDTSERVQGLPIS